jgi:hypothetical protein
MGFSGSFVTPECAAATSAVTPFLEGFVTSHMWWSFVAAQAKKRQNIGRNTHI